ncbi:uncharacterized protein LOC121422656 [Lytechinus variegatus]|uniref:uncharacterized protein LOC121422656 n=1 Tax=Lytechinus variegatus TaxID=7654 RepID=UPI001BB1EAD9|nr:uncharacterized protein LOC121422656 [Lytechinus variegatus]
MSPITTLLLCLSLGLISLVQGYPNDFDEAEGVADLMGDDELEGLDEMPMMAAGATGEGEGGGEGLSAQDQLLAFYERDRREANLNKRYDGISNLDRSITDYSSTLLCRVGDFCKKQFENTFNCKCNQRTYCVARGRNYNAQCSISYFGRLVFYQPNPTNGEPLSIKLTNNPITNKPTNSDSITNKPTNSNPITNKPTNGEPINNKPTNSNPITNKPTNSNPINNKPTNGKPINGKATNNK